MRSLPNPACAPEELGHFREQVKALASSGEAKRTLTFRSPVRHRHREKGAAGHALHARRGALSGRRPVLGLGHRRRLRAGHRPGQNRRQGQRRINAYPDKVFEGTVAYVYPTLKAETRTVPVRVELANPGLLLKPAMFAQVELPVGGKGPVVTVPTRPSSTAAPARSCWSSQGEGRFEPREVKLGARSDTMSKCSKGVKDGEQVVVAANFLIDAESNLKAALGGFGFAPAAAPAKKKCPQRRARAASQAKGAGHQAEGTVDSVDAKAGTVSLSHGPVASLKWPAMTMEFKARQRVAAARAQARRRDRLRVRRAPARRMGDHRPSSRCRFNQGAGTRPPGPGGQPARRSLTRRHHAGQNHRLVGPEPLPGPARHPVHHHRGVFAVLRTPIDALPDLSDVQVIVYTEVPGQAPQVVEDQVTYPLTTAMLSVPKSKVVRGFSFFGASFVYIIFEDGTDIYWARSRVLEYLNFASGRMPKGVTPQIGPDATGVGWVYQYALLAKDKTLAELRTIQDWYRPLPADQGARASPKWRRSAASCRPTRSRSIR
jgi:hypothetical protein